MIQLINGDFLDNNGEPLVFSHRFSAEVYVERNQVPVSSKIIDVEAR
jgi:hypothetical protein